MKNACLLAALLCLIANVFMTSALASPCLSGHKAKHDVVSIAHDAMPCHNPEEKDTTQTHCQDGCSCVHISSAHMLILANVDAGIYPISMHMLWVLQDETASSRTPDALIRPPITHS